MVRAGHAEAERGSDLQQGGCGAGLGETAGVVQSGFGLSSGVGKQSFDRKLEDIAALRSAPEEAAVAQLRKALKDRSNYAVSKAAAIAGERQLHSLTADLVTAFERFMTHGAQSDPQCWAKNAIAKALKDLEHNDADVFLRGTRHFQPEAVWGPPEDTAITLRGTCALALVGTTARSFDI